MPENEAIKESNALFVSGLGPSATATQLEELFSGVGPLRRCFVVTSDDSKKHCSGSGFVHFALLEDARKALSVLQGANLGGRRIKIDFARKRERSNQKVDDDGGLRKKRPRPAPLLSNPNAASPKKGSMLGSVASRTVLVQSQVAGLHVDADAVLIALGDDPSAAGFESFVANSDSTCLRLLFRSWPQAGLAASKIHSADFNACVDALRGGRKCRLIVRNLPFMVRVSEVRELFEKVARVREITLPVRKKSTEEGHSAVFSYPSEDENAKVKCGGFGFVEYFLAADANRAVKTLNEEKIGGRVIAVDLAIGRSAFLQKNTLETEAKSGAEDGNEEEEKSTRSGEGENEKVLKPLKKAESTEAELERTVFIRNLAFETSSQELWKAFEKRFGAVEQAVIVKDRVTGRPRGTAFVRFSSTEQVAKAVEVTDDSGDSTKKGAVGFTLQGRDLSILKATSRKKLKDAAEASTNEETVKERNARLAKIGYVNPDSENARALSEADLEKRAKAEKGKHAKLNSNPNAYVSDKRLIVRNMPKFVDEKFLKQMSLIAARYGSEGTKSRTKGLKKSETKILHCKIVRNANRNDISRGFGFVLFEEPSDALSALQFLNNNVEALDAVIKARPRALELDPAKIAYYKKEWGRSRRLLVEFSVEDSRQVSILEKVKEKGKQARIEAQKAKAEREKICEHGTKKGVDVMSTSKARRERRKKRALQDSEKRKTETEDGNHQTDDVISQPSRKRKKKTDGESDKFDGIVESYLKKLTQ